MKKLIVILGLVTAAIVVGQAQNINWRVLQEDQKNLVYVNFGYDFSVNTQIGYGRSIKAFRPLLLTVDYSFPAGKDFVDDFKVRYGGQMEIFEKNNFSVTAKALGNFRRYETSMVRIVSFGAEFSAIAGYYKPTWHVAAEFGFDKSIISDLSHKQMMRDIYPDIRDGWYIPSGGNLFYGIQAGKTLRRSYELSLRAGIVNAQGKHEDPVLKKYVQLGLIKKF